jgi:branched-chain amino acid transport system substrate-binding protein
MQAAVNAANAKGGANGHHIDLVVEDDQADASKNIVATRAEAAQGVVAIFENPITNVFNALVPVASTLNVTLLSAGTSSAVLIPAQQWIFGSDIPPPAEAPTELSVATSLLGKQAIRIAVTYAQTPASEEWNRNLATLAGRQGATILHSTTIPVVAADLTSQAEQVAAGNPEAVLAEITEANLIPMVRKLREKGFTGPIINYHGAGSDKDLEQLKDTKLYVARTNADYNQDATGKPGLAAYQKATQAAGYVDDATGNTQYPNGYVAGLMFIGAIEKCADPCNATQFNAAMNSLNLDTGGFTFSPVQFSSSRHQGLTAEVFYTWDGSKIVPALNEKSYPGILPVT